MPAELRALIDVLAWAGLRFGEATALRRQSVDLDARRLSIDSGYVEAQDSEGRFRKIEGTPKSHQRRTVMLTEQTTEALRDHLDTYVEPQPNALLFAGRKGTPLWYGAFRRRWDRAVEAAELPKVTPHDLRATCISLLISAGADPTAVQHHVGHADPGVTMRVYSQVNSRGDERLALALSSLQLGAELGAGTESRRKADHTIAI